MKVTFVYEVVLTVEEGMGVVVEAALRKTAEGYDRDATVTEIDVEEAEE